MAVALLACGGASAQVCTAAATGLTFGSYDPFAPSATAITGTVRVSCQATAMVTVSYSVQLGGGSGGSVGARSMASGAGRLAYQLYTSAARSTIWGDGSGGSGVVGDAYALAALGSAIRTYTAYGTIPARQVVRPGPYIDTVAVVVIY